MRTYPICCNALCVGYEGRPVAKDISFALNEGEILTLIGPNGSGKSTLLKSIAGQLKRQSGDIALFGRAIDDLAPAETARWMAVMLTERVRTEQTSCREVVSMGRYPFTGRLGILSSADEELVDEAMRAVGVAELNERDFSAISDGQRQRVLLARALAQQPEVLILDEPTSYLDIRHKLELLGLLRKMSRDRGLTVVMSLHEIDLAQRASDRVLALTTEGEASFGAPEEIFLQSRIQALFDLPQALYDPLYGSLELPPVRGEIQAFVLSGWGTGIPVYRRLQRRGMPFAAGILGENDADYRLACLLASEVVSLPPFSPITDAAYARAEALVRAVPLVIDAGFSAEGGNARMAELKNLAQELGKCKRGANAW